MRLFIRYLSRRPLVGNIILFGMIALALLLWPYIGKEQMPDLTMNWVRVSIAYPGASAEDVELFITRPVEEKLKGVTGLDEVTSVSSSGMSTFSIFFEPDTSDPSEKIQEVKDAVDAVDFPREAELPVYRQFKSSERAIIDVALFNKQHELLDVKARYELQEIALNFKNRLLSLKEISGMETRGYLRPEIQIKVDADKLREYELSMQQVIDQVQQQNVRTPVGSLTDKRETEITLISELDDITPIEKVIVSSGFEGQRVRLKDLAKVERGFEKANSITKVQGHEAIIFNVQKSVSVDILKAQAALSRFISEFRENNPDLPVEIVLMDDESFEIQNRLSLISSNGLMGFVLIVVILFLFLDLRSGVWVAMGIPFSLAVTLVAATLMGQTVNNMTLAAIIIVLGIVVDDAIIVAENISRKSAEGGDPETAAVEQTRAVLTPIIASVLTTCAAFIPLYFFTGRFGLFVEHIPSIVFLMLFASMLESFFILPGHMVHRLPGESLFRRFFPDKGEQGLRQKVIKGAERRFEALLQRLLPWRALFVLLFMVLLVGAGVIYKKQLRYVMFPREEAKSFSVKVVGPKELNRVGMAKLVRKVEDMFLEHSMGMVTSVRTTIGQGRRGSEVRENEASLRVELLPYSEREMALDDAIARWEKMAAEMKEFTQVRFMKDRFGSDSGSAIVIEIQENNDRVRKKVLEGLQREMAALPYITDIEAEVPVSKHEYRLHVKEEEVSRMGIGFDQLSQMLRAYVQGQVLYTLNSGEEEVDVRLMGPRGSKQNIDDIMTLRVANREGYLVPVSGLVKVEPGRRPSNIQRTNFKRAVKLYADIVPESKMTPLEAANALEKQVFPKVLRGNVSTNLQFRGEIEDSRESQSDFSFSIVLVLGIIYVLLVFLFDSLWTPLLIAAIIPFGVAGVIFALYFHGMAQYGFFAVVGTLGLTGVVVNDSIVLVDKMQEDLTPAEEKKMIFNQVASVTASRLRAVVVTTLTTVIGLLPTAYGWGGYDSMLSEMMIVMAWGLMFATLITLLLTPCLYSYYFQFSLLLKRRFK